VTFEIRQYRPADEAGWLRCRVLAFLDSDYYDDVKVAKTPFELPAIELVAERDGIIVGVIDVEIDGTAATIDTIGVHPDARPDGIASALLEAAVAQLPPHAATLDAWTRESAHANAWYRARDFVENYSYLHVYRSEGDPEFPGPDGLSAPVIAFMHATREREGELRAAYRRVYVCRQYLRGL
jgi:ribosomal protein S18 acetylase RimI-like enzyme